MKPFRIYLTRRSRMDKSIDIDTDYLTDLVLDLDDTEGATQSALTSLTKAIVQDSVKVITEELGGEDSLTPIVHIGPDGISAGVWSMQEVCDIQVDDNLETLVESDLTFWSPWLDGNKDCFAGSESLERLQNLKAASDQLAKIQRTIEAHGLKLEAFIEENNK
jgi:hypothetical protein